MSLKQKKEALKLVALITAYIVVVIPISSSVAFASLTHIRVYGASRKEGFRARDDSTTVEVLIPGEIEAENVILNNIYPFTSCIKLGTYTKCVYLMSKGEQLFPNIPAIPGLHKITIRAGSATGASQIIVDDSAPNATIFNITQDKGTIQAVYEVVDEACSSPQCFGYCSAIKKLDLVDSGIKIYENEINGEPNVDCEYDEIVILNLTGQSEQTRRICLISQDNAGNIGENCLEAEIDLASPAVTDLKMIRLDGKPVDIVSLHREQIVVYATFTDKNIDPGNIFADLVDLTANRRADAVPPLTCRDVSDPPESIICFWRPTISIQRPEDPKFIRFHGKDLFENEFDVSFGLGIYVDTSSPELVSIKSQGIDGRTHCSGDLCYVNKYGTNRLVLTINEGAGIGSANKASGLDDKRIFLDLSQFNSIYPSSGTQVDNCSCSASETQKVCTCYVDVVLDPTRASAGDRVRAEVLKTRSRDDAGNILVGGDFFDFVYDDQPPVMIGYDIPFECGSAIYAGDYPVKITLSEPLALSKGVFAVLNITKITTNKLAPFSCTQNTQDESQWDCELKISPSTFWTEYIKTDLPVLIEDLAGNPVTEIIPDFEVCEVDYEVRPNVFAVEVGKLFPGDIKRVIAASFYPTAMIQLSISSIADFQQTPEAYSKRIDCSESEKLLLREETGFANDESAYMVAETTYTPLVKLKLDLKTEIEDSPSLSSVDIKCNLSMRVRLGQKIYSLPQITPISKTIKLTELSVDWPQKAIDDKKQAVLNDIKKIDNDYNFWRSSEQGLRILAAIAETFVYIDTVLSLFKAGFQETLCAISLIPQAKPAAITAWQAGCKVFDAFHGFVYQWIWTPGCSVFGFLPNCIYSFAQIGKIASQINSCQLCGTGTLIDTVWKISTDGKYGFMEGAEFSWSPYKSIGIAKFCLCPSAIIFGIEKQRQIKCLKYHCIENAAKSGYPLTMCDYVEDVYTCTYVEGASWKMAGNGKLAAVIFAQYASFVGQQFLIYLAHSALVNTIDCSKYYYSPRWSLNCFGTPCGKDALASSYCALMQNILQVADSKENAENPILKLGEAFVHNFYRNQIESDVNWCSALEEQGFISKII